MRNFIFFLMLIFSSESYAQIGKAQIHDEVTIIGQVERLIGEYYTLYTLGYIEVGQGIRSYAIAFTNENTLYDNIGTDIRTLSFLATQEEFDYLYDFLRQGFKENKTRSLEVGQNIIKTVPPIRRFLFVYVNYEDGTSASFKLKKRQLAKLFGKK